MAAFQSQDDLSCPICQDVFKEPVLLSCSHSFCRLCLKNRWTEKPTQECPVCKRRSSRGEPPQNLALRNLCEAYVQQREQKASEGLVCEVHSERFKLFCLTDQQPVCNLCRDSKAHEGHRFKSIVEAAQDLKDELDKSLAPLKKRLLYAKFVKRESAITAVRIKKQTQQTTRLIDAEFKLLHQFLFVEEESRMKALREEEEQKTQKMKDQIDSVSKEIEALSETITATEEQLRAPDVSFLLKYKAAVERVQRCPLLEEQPQLGPVALINRAKHLGNLTFNIWINMRDLVVYSPVILDPNRVIDAAVTEDLTKFTFDEEEADKQSPELNIGVGFGSEGFVSGIHIWDVEVGNNEVWSLGVSADLGEDGVKKDIELWTITFSFGKYSAQGTKSYNSLNPVSRPARIRVCLDCDKHDVSFYDLDTNVHIQTFTQISQGKLVPYFVAGSKGLIKILPKKIGVHFMK